MTTSPVVLAADITAIHGREERLLPLLPQEEGLLIRKNRRPEDRQRRILARMLLAQALHLVEGWTLERGLAALRREAGGRPWIEGCNRPVSMSHGGRWAVCAVGMPGQTGIGVDVEEIRPLPVDDFRIVFGPQELLAIRTHPHPHSELIRRWTIKEAVLKARGTGLLEDPRQVDTSSRTDGWDWEHLRLDPAYHLTVAAAEPFFKAFLRIESDFKL